MANLFNVQNQIDILKSDNEYEKRQVLKPQNIQDVRDFIAKKRGTPEWEIHEASFREWEALVGRYDMEHQTIQSSTVSATTNVRAGHPTNYAPPIRDAGINQQNPQPQDLDTIRTLLTTVTPESLEAAVNQSEDIIRLAPPESQYLLRTVNASIIFTMLRAQGMNLEIRNNKVLITPTSPENIRIQEKLETLVNTGRIPLDNLRAGMLYTSPAFQQYARDKQTRDPQGNLMVDPKVSGQDFVGYLRDLKQTGNKQPDVD